ncbi:hypothetical protein [Vibrio rotiferianus]|uniref:hypothetical protein n=1 Tax=Vibrio rotiferianus TaxID=190895 RepID=UPI0005EDAAB2|nr:hypothetical protein [Vibrio rotiferianus]
MSNENIEKILLREEELHPFLPCWEQFKKTFSGIEQIDERFDLINYANNFICNLRDSSGQVTESQFVLMLMEYPAIKFCFVNKLTSKVWAPIEQTFHEFSFGEGEIAYTKDISDKTSNFYEWVISLCDWNAYGNVGSVNREQLH